jgi:choline monooxygenase
VTAGAVAGGGLPASWYCDADAWTRERTAIFAREWLFVGPAAQLEASGHHVAVTVAGYPLVVVNDGGTLRGFHNVCRHRGGPLVWEGTGAGPTFVCRYHGWAYGHDGRLRSARDFGDPHLCTDDLALHPVQVASWRGLVFANLDLTAAPLGDWLGGLVDECAHFPMESFVASTSSSHELAANWKVYAENYQEGYHIPLIHPGLHRQIDSRRYEVEVHDTYCVHRAPTRDGAATAGAWLWRFPGLALNLYPDGMCVESYAPSGPTTTRVDYRFFFAESAPDNERHDAVASSTTILEEDRVICEAVQRNLSSGLYQAGPLSPRHEAGVALVQSLVRRALEAPGG